jgi:predicted DsbA family dithiol-disulfide isomerase
VKVEIWSDVVCPWCYIGKRRLESALSQFEHADEVEIFWRSFQLNPEAQQGKGVPTLEYLTTRFGPQAGQMTEHVAEVAKGDGLDMDFSKALTVNTFDAHRMLHLAAELGVGDAAKERMLRAHFTEGADLGSTDTLVALMQDVGIDAEKARAALVSGEYGEEVRADIEEARALGANGVPFFVIDRKYGVSGAQPVETFLTALRTAYAG